jgi:hypothetical protein
MAYRFPIFRREPISIGGCRLGTWRTRNLEGAKSLQMRKILAVHQFVGRHSHADDGISDTAYLSV